MRPTHSTVLADAHSSCRNIHTSDCKYHPYMMTTEELPKIYTVQDVAGHNTRDDLWMTIHGKVYNVTRFLEEVICCLSRAMPIPSFSV